MNLPFASSDVRAKKTLLAIAFAAITTTSAWSQGTGTIIGEITDAETGEPLPGANIMVARTLLGASTDAGGRFKITRVPPGRHILNVSFIGYASGQMRVEVWRDSIHVANLALKPSAIPFDQVVVTGSRQAEDLNEAANSVSVLSASEIRQRDRFRIDEALQTIPGVELVGENVNVRGGTGYSLLGVGGSRVLMLIDDVPVLTSDLGRANWDILPVTELDRVEVLKGAASVLYGSGGISGVVNVITRRPTDEAQISFRHSIGIYSDPSVEEWKWTDKTLYFYRNDLSYSNTFGPVGLRLAVSRHWSTSDRENGDFRRWYLSGKSVIDFGNASELSLFFTYNNDARGFFLFGDFPKRPLETTFRDRINVDGLAASAIYNKLFSPTLSLKARLSFNSQLIALPLNLSKDFTPALGLSGELQMNWLAHNDHNLTFGVDYRRDVVEAAYYGKHEGDSFSPYVQETWKVSNLWQLSAGVRYDTYVLVGDSAETQLSPKIGLSFNPFHGTILHASVGRGFRAPSIAERFSEFQSSAGVRLFGNPGLRPERSTLLDAGIRQRFGESVAVEVTAFSNDYFELIELDQVGDLTFGYETQFRNFPHARIQGIETEVKLRLWHNRIGLHANAIWMDARGIDTAGICDVGEDDPLPYRARFSGFLSPSLTLGPLMFEADYRYVSRFEHVCFFPRYERVPQKVLDLRVRYGWKQYSLLFQVKNAINYNYTIVENNLGEIRNFSLSLSGEL